MKFNKLIIKIEITFVGGYNMGTYYAKTYLYDPTTDTWWANFFY